jgi:DNA-binding response OmpR family regulator
MRTLYIAEHDATHIRRALQQAGHTLLVLHPDEADWAIAENRHQIIIYDTAEVDLPRLRQWSCSRPAHAVMLVIVGENSASPTAAVLRAGADAFLRKPLSLMELEARIQTLLRHAVKDMPPSSPAAELLTVGLRAHVAGYAGHQQWLAPREHALLFLLARAAGNAVSRDVLCQHLWADDDDPRPERIDLYVSRLRRKLVALGAPDALQTVHGFGYRLRVPVALH